MKNNYKSIIPIFICLLVIMTSFSINAAKKDEKTWIYSLQIDTTYNLFVFKPSFSRVELEVGTMPSKDNDSIAFCAAAAFTKSIKNQFTIDNIVGGFIAGKISDNITATPEHYGRFISVKNKWKFVEVTDSSAIDSTLLQQGSMFTQRWIIKRDEIYIPYARKDSTDKRFIYRALCERNDTLMVAQSKRYIPYNLFVKALKAYGIENALYMDMGPGWNHSFYRDAENELHILFPHTHNYCTNWITFYK